MEYIVGQRWVSHADAQLGLGIVIGLEGRRVTLAFPAVDEERTYAIDNAPLTRLRFKPGDHISTIDNVELQVEDVEEPRRLEEVQGLSDVTHHSIIKSDAVEMEIGDGNDGELFGKRTSSATALSYGVDGLCTSHFPDE